MSSFTKKQLEDIIAGLNDKLEIMEKKIDALNGLPGTVARLEAMLEASNAKNANLHAALEHKEMQMTTLQLKLNSIEQHNRSWSIRINGMAVSNTKKMYLNDLQSPTLHSRMGEGRY